MRFFNIDCHVSVIEDVSDHLRALGHTVEDHSISGHHWTLGKPRASQGSGPPDRQGAIGYGMVNLSSWKSIFNVFPGDDLRAPSRAWVAERPELRDFDAGIACYPPSFALLYAETGRHVIVDVPIRYELPFTHRPDDWRRMNEHLVEGVAEGRMTVAANSCYDAAYYEYFTGQPALHISSTCAYVDRLTSKWQAGGRCLLAFGEPAGGREAQARVPGVAFVRDVFRRPYEMANIAKARGIVWIPYNASIMSFFEHYWLGIPLFVPSKPFLLDLKSRNLALSQLSWHASDSKGSTLPRVGTALPDPHTPEGHAAWLDLYDVYNAQEFPFVTYFDSWEHLASLVATHDYERTSADMLAFNALRRANNLRKWQHVVDRVALWSGSDPSRSTRPLSERKSVGMARVRPPSAPAVTPWDVDGDGSR